MPFLTVADVLRLPVIAAGLPRVAAGEGQLGRTVRWVHVTELLDPASFLEGGELVLTTGMPHPSDPTQLRGYVDQLADVGVAGLVVELGRRYQQAPPDLVTACSERELPLIVLARGVRFIEVTQTVHALILDAQGELLRRAQHVHELFTSLTLRGAEPEEFVQTASDLSGCPVVLENLIHHAVSWAVAGRADGQVLDAWPRRSRAAGTPDRAAASGPEGWLVAPVEERSSRWGRLVMLPLTGGPPFGPEHTMILEQAATALTLARLTGAPEWDRRAHSSVLLDLLHWRYRSRTEARLRAEALGLPTTGHRLLPVVVDHSGARIGDTTVSAHLADGLLTSGVKALVGDLSGRRTGLLMALARASAWQPVVERIALDLRATFGDDAVVAVGPGVTELSQVTRSFREAEEVADAIGPTSRTRPFHVASDVGLPELLYSLRDDVRVQKYVEHRLGRLVQHDARHGSDLLGTLREYLDAAGNKSIAAKRVGLSRQAFYQRLHTIERLLGADLEAGAERTQLHVAVTALEVLHGKPTD
ncbi:PucR family transcriptional regulator [Streptomyces sp. NBC_00989]|uniref:PucR family transcriptional regulator n=1 Tax=Streptomyces sp. NBC_00989 TaxID=2903705 RepID=UPI00386F6A6D|nr:PucR family transcriptional regulator ligand-binding domain-containing protein [Streptomyces sp. NBC_00989]